MNDYSWIKVKRFVDDPTLSWEERFKRLEKHHEEETKFLIEYIEKMKKEEQEKRSRMGNRGYC